MTTTVEDDFRLWAFRVYYDRAFATVESLTLRFAMALIESAKPVDPLRILEWKQKIGKTKQEQAEFMREVHCGRSRNRDDD